MAYKISDSALAEFIAESEEIIQRVSANLGSLEKGDSSLQLLDALYRDMHTMKGSAQLFGFQRVGKLAHAMEASLGPVRRLQTQVGRPLIDVTYLCLDFVGRTVKAIQSGEGEEKFDSEFQLLLPKLIDAASRQFGGEMDPIKDGLGVLEIPVKPSAPIPAKIPTPTQIPIEKTMSEEKTKVVSETHEKDTSSAVTDTTIRVQVALLDRLMNLVGGLVLVRNQVLQYLNRNEDLEFLNLSQSLNSITSDLQSDVMRTRMQPIGNILTKFQRVIRDLARDLGKKIDLTLQGVDTELDKTLLEAIKDPLTHIIRNSCDHGVETIEDRIKAKKPETGHVLVRAFHEGGQVVVEISDDGKGLDKERILAKAVEKGLVTPERAKQMQEHEIFNLIFAPGLSTAKQVSAVSGRGVGMDVVKTNIEKIGGTVVVSSVLGKGTTIRLSIPLTLAIVPAMIVRNGQDRFAIPQVKLVELVRVEGEGRRDRSDRLEFLQGKPMYRLRGELLPLVRLDSILQGKHSQTESQTNTSQTTNIVVLNAEGECFGLIVDEILDTADIVVKPLSKFLKSLSIFSGATIMGDGSVSLILDSTGIAISAKIDTKSHQSDESFADVNRGKKPAFSDAQEFLLFRLNHQSVHAIPLCLVHRLEEFKISEVEVSGNQRVVRYRDAILPLISLNRSLDYSESTSKENKNSISTIVTQRSGRNYGIEVDEILDIIMIDEMVDDSVRDRDGILGNVVYQSKVIVAVDVLGVIEQETAKMKGTATPESSKRSALAEIESMSRELKNKKVRILFAEDVAFFRKQVSKLLEQAGYEVTVCEDGSRALKTLETAKEDTFNLILSDIEMPNMNGIQLAQAVRKNEKFGKLPMIALTTRFKAKDVEEGKRAGFNLYMEKLNPEKLLAAIEGIMGQKEGMTQ